jgi:hypothetical protein
MIDEQRVLADPGRLAGHVRAGQQHEAAPGGSRSVSFATNVPAACVASMTGMAAVLDAQRQRVVDFGRQ